MTFNEIATELLSLPNVAIVTKGGLFYEDMHKVVRGHVKTISGLKEINTQALMLKQQLSELLETYDKCNKYTVGKKR